MYPSGKEPTDSDFVLFLKMSSFSEDISLNSCESDVTSTTHKHMNKTRSATHFRLSLCYLSIGVYGQDFTTNQLSGFIILYADIFTFVLQDPATFVP